MAEGLISIFSHHYFSVGDWPRNKTSDCGIPLGCTNNKDILNVAQVEDRATSRAYESSLLALSQVIESKQKRMANLTKMLAIPGLIDEHKTHIMEDIMKLMDIIQQKENLMEDIYSHEHKAPSVVEEFLSANSALKQVPATVPAPTSDFVGTDESNAEEVSQ